MPRPKKNAMETLDTPSAQLLAEKPKTSTTSRASRAVLIGDSDSEEEFHSAVQSPSAGGAFKVNEEYAQRFQYNKKREELQRHMCIGQQMIQMG